MTHDRAVEIAGVAVTSFATVTAGAVAIDASTVLTVLFGIGVAAVSGYFASRIQTAQTLGEFSAELRALRSAVDDLLPGSIAELREEMREYYERKGRQR